MENYVNTFRIGTDPEFFLVNKLAGVETLASFGGHPTNRKIGSDHGGWVVELRPDPSYTAVGLMKNIKTLMQDPIFEPYKPMTWRGGAYFRNGSSSYYIGGHIHLELPMANTYGMAQDEYNRRVEACDVIVKTLEELAIYPKQEAERRRLQWGRFGNVQIAGGEPMQENINSAASDYSSFVSRNIYRMEYRTPLSWMYDPRVAFITMAGIKLAAASPVTAINMLPLNVDKKVMWGNFIDFFRAFSQVDNDAKLAAYKLMNGKNLDNLKRLCVDHKEDFKAKWEKWSV
jgi:hypothetical protein